MAKRPCRRCQVELVERGYCEACRRHSPAALNEKRRGSSTARGYGGPWPAYSRGRLNRAEYALCEGLRLVPGGPVVVNTHPGRVVAATLTDHIVPHRKDKKLFWDKANHQSACDACHNLKTAKYEGGFGNKRNGMSSMG